MLAADEGFSSIGEGRFSEEQKQMIVENSQLRQTNICLRADLEKLQKQFDELIECCPSVETTIKENNTLKKQVSELKIENEEYRRRLEISLEMNKEMTEKVTKEQKSMDSSYASQISKLNDQIKSMEEKSKKDAQNANEKMKKINDVIAQNEREISLFKNQITKILNLAKNYFREDINDVEALLAVFLRPNLTEIADGTGSSESNAKNAADIQQYEKKISHYKNLLNNEKLQKKQLQLAFIQFKKNNELNALTLQEQKIQIDDLNRKHENELKQMEANHKQEILNLSNQLSPTLKYKSMVTQTDLLPSPEPDLKDDPIYTLMKNDLQLNSQTKTIDNSEIMEQMKNQIENLMDQLKRGEEKQERLNEKNKGLQIKIASLEKELKKEQRRSIQASTDLQQAQHEIESLNEQLNAVPKEEDINEGYENIANLEITNLKKAIEILEDVSTSQKSDINKLTGQRDYLISMVQLQNQALESFEHVIEGLKKSYNNSIQQNEDSSLPEESSFMKDDTVLEIDYGDLPETIVSILKRFTENDGFSCESKIHHIINVFSKFYKNAEVSHESEIKQLKEKIEDSTIKFENFNDSILNALGQHDLNSDQIVQSITDLSSHNAILQQRVNELEVFKEEVNGKESDNANMKNPMVIKLQKVLKELNSRYKLKKIELKECKAAFIEVQRRSADEIETLRLANERSRKELNDLQAIHEELHKQNQVLTEEVKEARNAQYNDYSKSQEEFENILMQNSSNFDEFQNKTNRDLHLKDIEITNLKLKVEEISKASDHWEKIAKSMSDEASKLKSRLNQAQKENEQRLNEVTRQREADIKDLEEHYTKTHDDLIAKNKELMEQIRKAKPANLVKIDREAELKRQELETQITQLTFQLQQETTRFQSEMESLTRQNKLIQVQNRAKLMAAETNYSMKCDEMKKDYEVKRKELFGFIAQQFREFYDVKSSLNEDAIKYIVKRIRIKVTNMKKKEESIRHILNAKPNQSTEDALTELILSMHPQLVEKRSL